MTPGQQRGTKISISNQCHTVAPPFQFSGEKTWRWSNFNPLNGSVFWRGFRSKRKTNPLSWVMITTFHHFYYASRCIATYCNYICKQKHMFLYSTIYIYIYIIYIYICILRSAKWTCATNKTTMVGLIKSSSRLSNSSWCSRDISLIFRVTAYGAENPCFYSKLSGLRFLAINFMQVPIDHEQADRYFFQSGSSTSCSHFEYITRVSTQGTYIIEHPCSGKPTICFV